MRRKFDKTSKPRNKRYTEIVDDLGNDRGTNSAPGLKKSEIQTSINSMARRDMYKSSYAIKVDPYKELNQASTVYDFITVPNKTYSPDYLGDDNLDGGYTSQYLTAKDSKLLHCPDTTLAQISLNYRFLNLDDTYENVTNAPTVLDPYINPLVQRPIKRGEMLLRKMYDAVNEALSQLDSTTFTYLSMNTKYSVLSTLYIPDVEPDHIFTASAFLDGGSTFDTYLYSDPAAVILITALAYQIPMLNAILGFNYVNKIKFYEALMLHMNYDRESDPLNSFFGQIMKSTFTTKLNSIILSLKGEYIDQDFIQTLNMITQIASRDADDIIDPVNEIVGAVVPIPFVAVFSNRAATPVSITDTNGIKFTLDNYTTMSCVWMSGKYKAVSYKNSSNQVITRNCSDTFSTRNGTYSMREYACKIATDYSITGILHWARNYNQCPLSDELANIEDYDLTEVSPSFNLTSADIITTPVDTTVFYNRLEACVSGIAGIMNKLKVAFPDLRTVFDKLQPLGIVNWRKGTELIINQKYDQTVEHYIIIDDLYKSVLSGPTNIKFSDTTGRWTSNTLWDKYEGVPEYDRKAGGQFIAYSGKTLDCVSNDNCNLEYIPKLYNYSAVDPDLSHYIASSTRSGDLVITRVQASVALTSIDAYKRLAILKTHESEKFRVVAPTHILFRSVDSTQMTVISPIILSWLEMNDIRNYGMFKRSDGTYVLKTSIVALYTYEILSSASSMIAYAKTAGVFRGTTDGVPSVGFKGLTAN